MHIDTCLWLYVCVQSYQFLFLKSNSCYFGCVLFNAWKLPVLKKQFLHFFVWSSLLIWLESAGTYILPALVCRRNRSDASQGYFLWACGLYSVVPWWYKKDKVKDGESRISQKVFLAQGHTWMKQYVLRTINVTFMAPQMKKMQEIVRPPTGTVLNQPLHFLVHGHPWCVFFVMLRLTLTTIQSKGFFLRRLGQPELVALSSFTHNFTISKTCRFCPFLEISAWVL